MANYRGYARTNYVTVEDIEGLKKALESWPVKIVTSDDGKVAFLGDDPDGNGWPTWDIINGEDVQFETDKVIMPFVKENEVLIINEIGHDDLRVIIGSAVAYVRQGNEVKSVMIGLSDIVKIAAAAFNIPIETITRVNG